MLPYSELHCHSYYSLLDGASAPEALVARAQALGMPALALTDHDSVAGIVAFREAAHAAGVHAIFGCELTLSDNTHLTLLAENERGWQNLCTLISAAQHAAPKGQAQLPAGMLAQHTAGLLALSGCRSSRVVQAIRRGDRHGALAAAQALRDRFGATHCFMEVQHHLLPDDDRLNNELVALAEQVGLGVVATNNVHYAGRDARRLQDVLVAIRHHTTLDEAGLLLRPNSEFFLKNGAQLAPLFVAHQHALAQSVDIAERCQVELRYGVQDLPCMPTPDGLDANAYLRELCRLALPERYGVDAPAAAYAQLEHELAVIRTVGLSNYFLVVWDIVQFARRSGVRIQGRGSAANSLVAYLLHISPIDPLAHNLVFERFLSLERATAPDIDLDVAAPGGREAVIQYVYQRHGVHHVALASTVVRFRTRSAVRDVAKVLSLPPSVIDAAERAAAAADEEHPSTARVMTRQPIHLATTTDLHPDDPTLLLRELCQAINGVPRHLGQHAGGMIVCAAPLAERVASEPARMVGRTVIQWDKDSLESIGLIKIDVLGLRMLSALGDAEAMVRANGMALDLDQLPYDDPAVYALISSGETVGIFQAESRAQGQLQPRLQPRTFSDLMVAISLIRPGPVQASMVHPYLQRRAGLEPVTYLHPLCEAALSETYGVILYQEQVLLLARDIAGFTPGQGEELRRSLGNKHASARLEALKPAFITGAAARGVDADTAAAIWSQLSSFAGYSFPKSHAGAFATIVYRSAYVMWYHPAEFTASVLNNQPMGFWSPAQLVANAQRRGVTVLPVDVDASQDRCSARPGVIQLGLCMLDGWGERAVERFLAARTERPFRNLADLCRRTQLPRRVIEHLILAGGLDRWAIPRRRLLWQLATLVYDEAAFELAIPTPDGVELPSLTDAEQLWLEEQIMGVSLDRHPLALMRERLSTRGICGWRELLQQADGATVRVAGRVVVHQAPPSARGVHFFTLEDEHGMFDIVVRPRIVARDRAVVYGTRLLLVDGTVQRDAGVTNVVASRLRRLTRDGE